MPDWQLKTPVIFMIFNRPDTTARVFEAIQVARPPMLLVVADGPRPGTPGEAERCKRVRGIIERVDWPCEVLTNYSDVNLGCKQRVSSGLDWAFDTVEEAIILEDDCLPHPTFFRYCEELLELYRHDKRIMMISGDNFQFDRKRTSYSYYFSRYVHVWGWASWRRAWKKYDVSMKLWPDVRDGGWLQDVLCDTRVVRYWSRIFDRVYSGEINTWDFQWTFACLVHSGLVILPNSNLISNIGFRSDATHTAGHSSFANLKAEPILFPLSHPPFIVRDAQADAFTDRKMHVPSYITRAVNKFQRFIR